jgi:hypothetical protein
MLLSAQNPCLERSWLKDNYVTEYYGATHTVQWISKQKYIKVIIISYRVTNSDYNFNNRFLGWGQIVSTWYVRNYLVYCTSPMMILKQSVEWLAGETKELGENLLQCHFDCHKSHITWPWIEPGPPGNWPLTASLVITQLKSYHSCQ